MDINTFDILLLFILAIAVSLIIGFNILFMLNQKLNNIKINIPKCPVPNVYIKNDKGVLVKVKMENNTKEIIENFDHVQAGNNSNVNIQNNNTQEFNMDQYNNYVTSFMMGNGDIKEQNVKVYVPKTYMDKYPYGEQGIYDDNKIEKEAGINELGSIQVNNYTGNPQPILGF